VNTRAFRATLTLCAIVLAAGMAMSDCYVTVLHFNDFHGHLQSKEKDGKAEGGIARMATMVDEVRQYNDAHGVTTLFFEAGDILQGTPLSTVYKGEPDVKCLNLMRLDAMCIGNHEFDFGQDVYEKMVSLAEFPILSANIYYTNTGQRFTKAIMYFTLADGTNGAAFGLTTPETAVQTSPKNVIGLRFSDPIEEARKVIGELRGKADFIVAITHLGYEEDLKLGEAVDGLDLIIGGHSHTEVQPPTEAGDTLVCQAQSYGLFLGQVDMLVSKGDIVKYRGFLRPVDERSRPRPDVQAIVDKYADELQERLAEVVATTTVDLDGIREHIRASETNLGNLVCDLIRDYAQADVCLWNGGGIRASIDAGPVTVGDILTVLPFGNIVANKQITGAELRKVLEFNAAQPRPFGGFTQVSGMTMEIIGDKLGKVTVGGQPLDDAKTYTLAASEFMLAGGDGYSMLTEGSEPVYLGYSESAIVLEALRELGTVSPAVEGRIIIK
jgi:2',3'-cyclic-nucleotide 2'-phosphodiesterase (5'-nucleotidase family)